MKTFCKKHNIDEKLCFYLSNYYKKKLNLFNKIQLLYRIKKKYPYQYIVENTNFYGYTYKVTKDVLIPRFETELLVETLIKKIKKNSEVLDLCTGSGCIGLTLKQELKEINLTISDISKKALKIAKENSKNIDVKIVKGDLLKPFINKKKFDVIVCNPPYVSYEETVDISTKYEPKKAIFAKNKGLYFYDKVLQNIQKVLKKNYIICFEIGETQKTDILKICKKNLKNYKTQTIKDYNKKDRIIIIENV